MDKEEYKQKRKELQKKISKLYKKKRELEKKQTVERFKKEKKAIKRYYINSYRKEFSDVFYRVMNTIEKGKNGSAYVKAYKLSLNNNDNYFGITLDERLMTLRMLRNMEPIDKEEIKKTLTEPKENIIKLVKDNFNIEL